MMGDGAGCLARGVNAGAAGGDDEVHLHLREFRRPADKGLLFALREAPLDQVILAFDVTEFAHAFVEAAERVGGQRRRACANREEADAPALLGRLREAAQRRGQCNRPEREHAPAPAAAL